jgi:hypothetical protein
MLPGELAPNSRLQRLDNEFTQTQGGGKQEGKFITMSFQTQKM